MIKKFVLGAFIVLFALPGGLLASTTTCATKYPIVLSHGMGAQANILGIINYWGSIPSALKNKGASVYITSVNGMDARPNKAASWKTQVLNILAVSGKEKVNVIGHSDGCLYTRYAISNLGMSSKVASHTSIAGPHRGSAIADMLMGVLSATGLTGMTGDTLNWVYSFVMGDVNPNSVAQGQELERSYMINTFNPNTPNKSGIYYQSYAYKVTNLLGGGLLGLTWAADGLVEGDNDGLVSVTSAQWGTYKGVIYGGILGATAGGVNHLAAVGLLTLVSPGYDAPTQFASIAADLKSRGY